MGMPRYIMYRIDHPSDVKRGGVCICYKTMLSLKVLSTNFLQECINFEKLKILESSSSCIDLIFSTLPNMVLESRVHHSLHQNRHHQIIFAKFNLKVYYPPRYERTIFYYSQANVDHIQQAINLSD